MKTFCALLTDLNNYDKNSWTLEIKANTAKEARKTAKAYAKQENLFFDCLYVKNEVKIKGA